MKKINKILKALTIFSLVGVMGFISTSTSMAQTRTICTQDAKMCPDGTFVGRTGPKCEFVCNKENKSEQQTLTQKELREKKILIINELKKQIQKLKERIQKILAERSGTLGDIVFTKKMSIGSTNRHTNNEVTKLQKFLISENVYPEKLVTGYYGKLTSRAVQKLKKKYDINTYPGVEWSPKIYELILNKKKNTDGIMCTMEYEPVCGKTLNQIRCIKAPCPNNSVKKTFSNKCELKKAKAEFLYKGKCKKDVVEKTYSGDLKQFLTEKELKNFISENKNKNNNGYRIDFPFMQDDGVMLKEDIMPMPVMFDGGSVSIMEAKSSSNSIVDSDYSKTNIQVEGVDEADITKTDGKYIYTITQGRVLSIIDAKNPEKMKVVSTIKADKNENIRSMFLYKNKLVLITNIWEEIPVLKAKSGADMKILPPMPYYGSKNYTRVEIYNITNPVIPIKEKTIEFEGNNMNKSRVINGKLYLLTNKYINWNNPIPIIRMDGKNITERFGTSTWYIDEPFYNNNILSINALNLDNVSDISTTRVLMPYLGQVFVSTKNIYLTHTKYLNKNKILFDIQNKVFSDLIPISKKDSEIIEKIKNTDDDVLSKWDKIAKINNVYKKYENILDKKQYIEIENKISEKILDEYKRLRKEFQKTKIEKFSLKGTKVTPVASGVVSGTPLNQFSMNEKNGFFEIATTNNAEWLPWQFRNVVENNRAFETENNLYILDKELNPAGKIEGMAKGERIQSVRFVGNKAYLVTFRQVDPLFNIDISNPYNPRLLGELKIPGFSQYLHPVYKDRLIGLGRDVKVDENGNVRNAGLKVTLFDTSSDKPKEIKTLYFGKAGSYSEALNNHKAVLISDKKNIMAFPASLYKESIIQSYSPQSRNNSVVLLKISKDDISLISKLHQDSDWNKFANRSLYIGDNIYTVAPVVTRSFNISDGEELGKVSYAEDYNKRPELLY